MEAMFTTVKPQLHKRPRHNNDDVDADDDDNSSSSISNSPRAKQLCSIPERAGPKLICTLPPTCSPPNKPSHLLNSIDLEKHYALYHAHVCEVKGCGCVFPEERLLELHLSECHDPLSEVRKERGERTFGCFLPPETCNRKFLNPKARRLHLIQAHGYPKQYFFAVTNKGIGGLLKKWGEGASLLRGEWKPRDNTKTVDVDMEDDDDEQQLRGEEDEDEEDLGGPTESSTPRGGTTAKGDALMEDLATNLQSVSLQVPTTIRFGRGGSTRGFVGKGSGGATARKPHPHQHHTSDSGGESYTNTSISMTGGENSSRAHSHPRPSRRSRGRGNGGTPSSLLSRTDANLSPKPNLTATQSAPSRRGPVPNSSFVTVNSRGRGRGKIWVANA